MKRTVHRLAIVLLLTLTGMAPVQAGDAYPTRDALWYGLGCLERNGDDALALEHCACALDHLEAHLPHDDFQAARVLVALGGVGGERAGAMARTATASRAVERFVEAQRAATAACF
ncbi:MAG: hypothetical protein RLW61_06125 [Gammaproteobacteria bacterium]